MSNEKMNVTIPVYTENERKSFEEFSEFISARIEDGIFASLTERMRTLLRSSDKAQVALPWGKYTANGVKVGESGNINVSFEPSAAFIEALNSDDEKIAIAMDDYDPEFLELFHDYVAYGFFYPNAPENKDRLSAAETHLCLNMEDNDAEYFLNHYADVLVQIAKDKQRDGKIYRLEINNSFDHGYYDFEYVDGKIIPKFTASKFFKQCLKNDESAVA